MYMYSFVSESICIHVCTVLYLNLYVYYIVLRVYLTWVQNFYPKIEMIPCTHKYTFTPRLYHIALFWDTQSKCFWIDDTPRPPTWSVLCTLYSVPLLLLNPDFAAPPAWVIPSINPSI